MYIDGVFSGGGIKGFALVGAYQSLESSGYRFVRVAGTSAGSIISSFIAAGYTSTEVLHLMEELDLKQFLDERRTMIPFKFMKWLSLYWRLGLYKGNKLEEWIDEKLHSKGVSTFGDLRRGTLKVIASDLTNGRMIVLPDDLPSYGFIPEQFSVAKAVRMSCSLPYFFEPVKLTTPDGTSIVVDGGVLSNFPIWLFKEKKSLRPIIGVKLSANEEERPKNKIQNAIEMYGALFETMKDAHDSRHIASRHERNIVFIPVDTILSTEFEMTEQKKLALIELGKAKTEDFLKRWAF
ncbi:patatin-like phospholipase family protein [Metabacillus arenae]|uniref:Patatin-like phospholipase family protein n=1 Tax=Metabacillus arenae TaxID=2771434 RepID=A0A926RUQ8_9BACI|nr:patatin-like phospholipase family protein [Metabacillus arenae]MBD1378813.1 patatin-like phospholipase family protein [Metabacillus arenae]